jgi:hypothetical protein
VEDRNNRQRAALGIVDDEIRIDAPELDRPIGQVLARVADTGLSASFPAAS